jgi:hypothetical protein
MRKLDKTLQAAQEPTLLEMRILANHGSDPRFSFLRKDGQWREEWEQIRREGREAESEAQAAAAAEQLRSTAAGTLQAGPALVGYGSEEDSEGEPERSSLQDSQQNDTSAIDLSLQKKSEGAPAKSGHPPGGDEAAAAEERARKRAVKVAEWAEKRKAAREQNS